jgi:hypothetical protein
MRETEINRDLVELKIKVYMNKYLHLNNYKYYHYRKLSNELFGSEKWKSHINSLDIAKTLEIQSKTINDADTENRKKLLELLETDKTSMEKFNLLQIVNYFMKNNDRLVFSYILNKHNVSIIFFHDFLSLVFSSMF